MTQAAILFDLDGTLLNTLEDLADATNRALARVDCPGRPLENFRFYVGNGALNLVRCALPEDRRDEATVATCLAAFQEEYAAGWDVKTHPYEGVPELPRGSAQDRRVWQMDHTTYSTWHQTHRNSGPAVTIVQTPKRLSTMMGWGSESLTTPTPIPPA